MGSRHKFTSENFVFADGSDIFDLSCLQGLGEESDRQCLMKPNNGCVHANDKPPKDY